jgi:hypothetical protein
MSQMNQSQVPDGMVANVPWGTPLERWTDRMIERGLTHLDSEGEGTEMFPRLFASMGAEATKRGIVL